MNLSLRRASAGIASISLFLLMGQGCPGPGGLPGSSTISSLEVTDAVAGGTGRIRVTLVDPVSSNTKVTLAAGNAGIADVPATLTIPDGSASGTADYTAIASGVTTITASLGDSQRTETASVVGSLQITELFASGADLDSGGTALQTGASGTIGVFLNATVSADTIVNLTSDNPDVVAVPAAITIPEFEDGQSIAFVAAAAGVTTITAELNGQVVTTKIAVSDTVTLVSVNAFSPFQAGTMGQFQVNLDVSVAADTTISLTSSDAGVATIPETAVIPAGDSSVYVPFQAVAAGQSTLTATLDSTSRSLPVTVVNGISLTLFAVEADFLRTEASLLTGKAFDLSFQLSSAPNVDTVIPLTSSDPSVVNLPPSVTIPAGFNFMSFPFLPSGPGATTLTATLSGAQSTVKLTFVDSPSVTELSLPGKLLTGAATTLRVATDVAPALDTAVDLSSSNTSVLTVPATMVIPAGQTSATIPLTAGISGTTFVTATLGSSQASAVLSVVSQVSLVSANGGGTLEVGGVSSVFASLNVGAPTDKTIAVSVTPSGVISAPTSLVIPAGSTFGSFFFQAIGPGDAIIDCTLDGVSRKAVVKVVNKASVQSVFGFISVGSPGTISIGLDAVVSADTVVTITNSDPAAFTTPATAIVEAGSSSASFQVFGLAAVPTTITATLGASNANAIITPSP